VSTLGIAGDPSAQKLAAARAAGLSTVGVAGANTAQIIGSARAATGSHADLAHSGVGDRAQLHGWRRASWLADYTYLVTPYQDGRATPAMHWRSGYAETFARDRRTIPVLLDSTGFRRCLTGTAPVWAGDFERYVQAIDLIDPDGYAAWDDPRDRATSLRDLDRLRSIYPGDDRLWPVWSVRWSWDVRPPYRLADLPRWGSRALSSLVPRTKTHRLPDSLEDHARLAVLNAVVVARDPDFQRMAARHGKVMIGGLVKGPINCFVRHLFIKALRTLVPAHYWLLGQASAYVANGLAYTGELDHVSVDGSWWVQDALCHKVAYLDQGLINVVDLGARDGSRESFFTTRERMAALLRSLLSLWAGLVTWPAAPALPVDFADLAQLRELQGSYRGAQLELFG